MKSDAPNKSIKRPTQSEARVDHLRPALQEMAERAHETGAPQTAAWFIARLGLTVTITVAEDKP